MAREHEIGRWRRVARVLEAEAEQLSSPEAKSAKILNLHAFGQNNEISLKGPCTLPELLKLIRRRGYHTSLRLVQNSHSQEAMAVLLDILSMTGRVNEFVSWTLKGIRSETAPEDVIERCIWRRITLTRLDDRDLSRRCLCGHQHVGHIGDDTLIAHTKRHLERWPDDDEIAILRAENLATLSRFDDALKALVTTSAHSSKSMTKATLRLAAAQISLNQLEDPAEAINHVRDALAFEPKLAPEALALLTTIEAEWQINLDLAIPFIETLDELGQFERSQQIWATCIANAPDAERAELCSSGLARRNAANPDRAFKLL